MTLVPEEREEFLTYCLERYESTKASIEKLKTVFLDNQAMRQLIAVWPQLEKDVYKEGDTFYVNVSYTKWCSLALLPVAEINLDKCEKLISLGAVLPDGKIHFWIEEKMNSEK